MKILLSWLREFVDVPGSAEEIAARMSVRGFAVEGIEAHGENDAVLDFEITANRPDCMSVAGMAREVATAYGLELKGSGGVNAGSATHRDAAPGLRAGRRAGAAHDTPADPPGAIRISIDNLELCPRYVGARADVTVAPSPDWMQQRLRAAGVRPISNIVDITNYVLLELGQPMHAFDYAKLGGGEIRVRTAGGGETIATLDGQSRELTPDMLVIADATAPVAVAGVMGGAHSEVTASTTQIVFESAYFNPLSVRRTSKKLGLKTEASMRFERGADPSLPAVAMARACELLASSGAGQAHGEAIDNHPAPSEARTVHLRRPRIAGLLGASIADDQVVTLLSSLGFTLSATADGWDVTVPTRRVDVVREVDLIEEVARHHGFDRIPVTFPALTAAPAPVDPRITRTRQLRTLMTGCGFYEAVTFGFTGLAAASPFAAAAEIVAIANPLSENFAVLRPSLLPGLVAAVAHNRRREQRDVRLFEIGGRFTTAGGEQQVLASAWSGAASVEHWGGRARDVDFFDLKGVIERIRVALAFDAEARSYNEPGGWLTPGRAAALWNGETRLATFGQLSPQIADSYGIPAADAVYVAELDLDAIEALRPTGEVQVEPLPRHPSVTRDIAILLDDTLAAAAVRETIQQAAPSTLVRIREFDRYQGPGVPENKVSLALRLTFRSADRTLTDAEIHAAMETVLAALRDRHGAIQR
jgi:phenylalanyl-tRNA synthetase beta chain